MHVAYNNSILTPAVIVAMVTSYFTADYTRMLLQCNSSTTLCMVKIIKPDVMVAMVTSYFIGDYVMMFLQCSISIITVVFRIFASLEA